MRHDRCADDADGQQDAVGIAEPGNHGMIGDLAQIGPRQHGLREIGRADDHNQHRDHRLDGAEPVSLEPQHGAGRGAGEQRSRKQRDVEQELESDACAEELGEVGRYRADLARDPHRIDEHRRQMEATELSQVLAADDAELRRQRLEQHRHQIGEYDHPEQIVAVARTALDIRGEIARVHIGDRGDDGRPHEWHNR